MDVITCSVNCQGAGTSEQSFSVEQSILNATPSHIHSFIQSSPSLQSYIGLSCFVALMSMESDKTRALRIVRNAELVHPGLPLVEAFLNDAVDGDQLQDICCKHTPMTGVMQTLHDS
jgi:hypothetical protein